MRRDLKKAHYINERVVSTEEDTFNTWIMHYI